MTVTKKQLVSFLVEHGFESVRLTEAHTMSSSGTQMAGLFVCLVVQWCIQAPCVQFYTRQAWFLSSHKTTWLLLDAQICNGQADPPHPSYFYIYHSCTNKCERHERHHFSPAR